MANCTADNAQFVSPEACAGFCAKWEPGTAGETTNNTLGCHIYHADAAAAADGAALHCPHAGPSGAG